MLHIPGLYIAETSSKGRGVFTAHDVMAGDMIEICPVLRIPEGELIEIDKTKLYDYYFLWEEKGYRGCIALGYGSLYNHSAKANAFVIFDYTDQTIKVECKAKIQAGEEILIDYTDGIKSEEELWFKPLG